MTESFPTKLHSETGGPEHDFEPVPGLPAMLPEGERIVWQGAPAWRVLLRQRLKARWVTGYFFAIGLWVIWSGSGGARPTVDTLIGLGLLTVAGAFVLGFLAFFAKAVERTALYTVTNRRIVMRVGVALSATYNLPFAKVENVDLRANAAGQGEVAVRMADDGMRLAWLMMWPNVRPWRITNVEPQMVGLTDASLAASVLSEQVIAYLAREHTADAEMDTHHVMPVASNRAEKPATFGQLATQ